MKGGLIAFICLLSFQGISQDRIAYINKFKEIAIVEMQRTGIPASIKLAQGILESNAGGSMLAVKANNHFGIKCGSSWKGKTMMRKDDDRDSKGKLVNSCFRTFNGAFESYVAHSDFLTDPNKAYRYGFLFGYSNDDYKSWAHGLKKAGYATNPSYPKLLIRIIELYELDQIDAEAIGLMADGSMDRKKNSRGKKSSSKNGKSSTQRRAYPIKYHNDVKTVIAYGDDTPRSIAKELGISAKKIVSYNESIGNDSQAFVEDQRVYLQPKRGKYKGRQQFHMVKDGETMLEISDKYGVKVASLYKRNGITNGLQPAPGQKLALKKKNKRTVKVLSHTRKKEVFIDNGREVEDMLDELIPNTMKKNSELKEGVKELVKEELAELYTVLPNDTLYRIARMHGLQVETLKKINNLDGNSIQPGQKLKLEE